MRRVRWRAVLSISDAAFGHLSAVSAHAIAADADLPVVAALAELPIITTDADLPVFATVVIVIERFFLIFFLRFAIGVTDPGASQPAAKQREPRAEFGTLPELGQIGAA